MSWLPMDISKVWALLFLLEVALLGKVRATSVPPVLKLKVYDEEKLLWVKCSWDTSGFARRMPHRCWCCSWLHHRIAPASPSLQEAFCPSPGLLGTSQPAECKQLTTLSEVGLRGPSGHPRSSVMGWFWGSNSPLPCRQRHCAIVLGKQKITSLVSVSGQISCVCTNPTTLLQQRPSASREKLNENNQEGTDLNAISSLGYQLLGKD